MTEQPYDGDPDTDLPAHVDGTQDDLADDTAEDDA